MTLQYRLGSGALLRHESGGALMAECCCAVICGPCSPPFAEKYTATLDGLGLWAEVFNGVHELAWDGVTPCWWGKTFWYSSGIWSFRCQVYWAVTPGNCRAGIYMVRVGDGMWWRAEWGSETVPDECVFVNGYSFAGIDSCLPTGFCDAFLDATAVITP